MVAFLYRAQLYVQRNYLFICTCILNCIRIEGEHSIQDIILKHKKKPVKLRSQSPEAATLKIYKLPRVDFIQVGVGVRIIFIGF